MLASGSTARSTSNPRLAGVALGAAGLVCGAVTGPAAFRPVSELDAPGPGLTEHTATYTGYVKCL